jgi:hypothetical protein
MTKRLKLTGQKFGRLTVAGFSHINKHQKSYWNCVCECGNKSVVCGGSLVYGHIKSCGCLQKEKIIKTNITHNLSRDRFYKIYFSIKNRCLNKKDKNYNNYGGRGIKVCTRWLKSFENFRDDMYPSYLEHIKKFGKKQTTIDRTRNNGNYCKNNCSWENYTIQENNKRNNHLIKFNGKEMTMSEWAKELNISYTVLRSRINRFKWSIKDALTIPIIKGQKRHSFKLIEYNGENKTMIEWSRKININLSTLNVRIKILKWPIEKAFSTPVKKRTESS